MHSESRTSGQAEPARKRRISVVRVLVLLVPALILFCTILFHAVWRPHSHGSPRSLCVAHLKQIEGAKATWALEHRKQPTDVPTDSDLFGTNRYIFVKPKCPAGGNYTLGAVSENPRCSIPSHTLPEHPER